MADTATRYSGQLTIKMRYHDARRVGGRMRRDYYAVVVTGPHDLRWRGNIHPPAHNPHAVDSRLAFSKTARAALAFADDERRGIGDYASYGKGGYVVSTWKRARPARDRRRRRR